MVRPTILATLIAVAPLAPASAAQTDAPEADTPVRLAVEQVASGLSHPWGLAFLPDETMLVTERGGDLVRVAEDGATSEVGGVPDVAAAGQGGLLDVAIGPDFASDRMVYLAFSEPGEGGASTAVARGRLAEDAGALQGVEVIYRQTPKLGTSRHYGARLVFAPDGTLFVTQGDRATRPEAQNLANHVGTIVRINPDGSVPDDNPFVGTEDARAEIYSYGHRNIQGADLAADGTLWTVEHGARGGDEINRPVAGRNYGWPRISYGRHYSGGRIGEGTAAEGLEQPVYYWDPSIAPSGLAVVDGPMFPEWRGDILVGALKDRHLARLVMEDGEVVAEERLLEGELGRVREVDMGPDGAIYVLNDERSGGVYRLTPAD